MYLYLYLGVKKPTIYFLITSGLYCLISPIGFRNSILIFWGCVVIADSHLFSTLVVTNTKTETKGTAIKIVNSIGFSITIKNIQMLSYTKGITNETFIFLILAIRPITDLQSLLAKKRA